MPKLYVYLITLSSLVIKFWERYQKASHMVQEGYICYLITLLNVERCKKKKNKVIISNTFV